MPFSLGKQNETPEAHIGALETETKIVAKLVLVKSFHMPNAI